MSPVYDVQTDPSLGKTIVLCFLLTPYPVVCNYCHFSIIAQNWPKIVLHTYAAYLKLFQKHPVSRLFVTDASANSNMFMTILYFFVTTENNLATGYLNLTPSPSIHKSSKQLRLFNFVIFFSFYKDSFVDIA